MKIIYRQTRLKHSTSDIDLWYKVAEKLGITITVLNRGTTNYLVMVDVQYSIICEGDISLIDQFDSLI